MNLKKHLQTARGIDKPVIRNAQIMEVPLHFDLTHFRGLTATERKFVYCPVGNICSWSEGDYDNKWCEWCKNFFSEVYDAPLSKGKHS